MDLIRHCAALLLFGLLAPVARAECMGEHGGLDGDYARLMRVDPARAVRQLEASVMALGPAASGKAGERAHQLAMLADAYEVLGRNSDAVATIARGIASIGPRTDPRVALRLRLREAGLREDSAAAPQVLAHFEAVAQGVEPGDPIYLCMLVDRGYLRYRADQLGPAISDLSVAMSLARQRGSEQDRIDVGSSMSLVYQSLGFFDEALLLAEDSVKYYETKREPLSLVDALYRRARARTSMGDFAAAEPDLQRAFGLATANSDLSGAFFAQITYCDLLTSSGRTAEAETVCKDAAARARTIDDWEGMTRARIMLGEVQLEAGRPAAAIALIDSALASGGTLLRQVFLARALMVRARAQTKRGDYQSAYADLEKSLEIGRQVSSARASQRVDLLRVRSEIARKDRELLIARQQAELLEARAQRDRTLRNLLIAIAALALLSGWLLARAKQRRRAADSARRVAESQLESLGRLAAGVAHDFNNLLTVVQQASGLLARMPAVSDDPDAASLVRATREAASTGGSITAQLLSFGRQQNLRPESLLLADFFAAQQAVWCNVLGRDAQLQVSLQHPSLTVFADRGQLSSALVNLLANARDAAAGSASVSISAFEGAPGYREGEVVRIEVSDRGHGMTPEVLARATEPFYSTKEPGRGSGLGLSAVQGFARQSNGQMHVRSEAGQGTTVTIVLPRQPGSLREPG